MMARVYYLRTLKMHACKIKCIGVLYTCKLYNILKHTCVRVYNTVYVANYFYSLIYLPCLIFIDHKLSFILYLCICS